jgi:FkbM family methyltransferase
VLKIIDPKTPIVICDIGAAEVDTHQNFINNLFNNTNSIRYGFEPNKDEYSKLKKTENCIYFNTALGDGTEKDFIFFNASGMNSFLEPNNNYLNLFQGFDQWTKIVKRAPIKTEKLDNIKFRHKIDLFKIDTQGSESEIIEHGKKKISEALCVQIEASPTPLYSGEKTFSTISKQLEDLGFALHMFNDIHTRPFKPMTFLPNNPFVGLNHIFQLDCVFVKNIDFLLKLENEELSKIILILFYCFKSYDLVHVLISKLEKRVNKNLIEDYQKIISKLKIEKKY